MYRFFLFLAVLLPLLLVIPCTAKTKKDNSIVTVIDRPYRTLIIMPFRNLSGNKDYDFLAQDLRVFIASELKILGQVTIRSDDFSRPTNLPPGVKRKFVLNSDRKRRLILPDMNTFTNVGNPVLGDVDYIVNGYFSSASKRKDDPIWVFTIGFSNTRTLKQEHVSKIPLPYGRVLERSADLTEPLKRYLNDGIGCNLRIVSSVERTEVYSGVDYVSYAPVEFFLKKETNALVLKKEAYTTVTNVILLSDAAGRTNPLQVTMKRLAFEKMISITSRPEGSRAYLNEKFIGVTPLSDLPVEGSDLILFAAHSNYQSAFMKADLVRNDTFHFTLKPYSIPGQPKFSNKSMAWTSFFMGTAVLGGSLYYLWQSEYYFNLGLLKRSQTVYDQGLVYYNIGSAVALCSIPFFAATFYFTVRYSDEKDW